MNLLVHVNYMSFTNIFLSTRQPGQVKKMLFFYLSRHEKVSPGLVDIGNFEVLMLKKIL